MLPHAAAAPKSKCCPACPSSSTPWLALASPSHQSASLCAPPAHSLALYLGVEAVPNLPLIRHLVLTVAGLVTVGSSTSEAGGRAGMLRVCLATVNRRRCCWPCRQQRRRPRQRLPSAACRRAAPSPSLHALPPSCPPPPLSSLPTPPHPVRSTKAPASSSAWRLPPGGAPTSSGHSSCMLALTCRQHTPGEGWQLNEGRSAAYRRAAGHVRCSVHTPGAAHHHWPVQTQRR